MEIALPLFSTYYVCKYLKQSRCVRFSFSIDYGAEKCFLLVGHLHYYFLKLLLFPNLSLGKTVSGPSHPKERLGAGRHSLEYVKWSNVISWHPFSHKENVNHNLKFSFRLLRTRMQHKNIILWVLWFFFFFWVKVNAILLNSTFILYLMFRHKAFHKQYTQWGLLWWIQRKKKKMGFKSPNPLTNLLIQSPASCNEHWLCEQDLLCCWPDSSFLLSVFLSSA